MNVTYFISEITSLRQRDSDSQKVSVIVSSNLKPSNRYIEFVKVRNKLVGFTGRSYDFISEKLILTLYNSLERPHLQY